MKSKVVLSRFSSILTAILILGLFVGCIATIHEKPAFFTLLAVYLVLIVCALFFGTSYIEATLEYVVMGSILIKRKISIANIESVELFRPTMGAIRICGSGGFLGYWGIFQEGDIGKYSAFYGKASDCFLIRMKNGSKYVLSCENPSAMVDYINSLIKRSTSNTPLKYK